MYINVKNFRSKNPVFGSKSLEKVWKSLETGFSECSEILEILEIVVFRTFRKLQKLQKYNVKLELRKSRKTHSDSKVRLKVLNAGPYVTAIFGTPRQVRCRQEVGVKRSFLRAQNKYKK